MAAKPGHCADHLRPPGQGEVLRPLCELLSDKVQASKASWCCTHKRSSMGALLLPSLATLLIKQCGHASLLWSCAMGTAYCMASLQRCVAGLACPAGQPVQQQR